MVISVTFNTNTKYSKEYEVFFDDKKLHCLSMLMSVLIRICAVILDRNLESIVKDS